MAAPTNIRMERIEKLLNELSYEVERGMMEREVDEHLGFRFYVPISSKIPDGVVFCEFRTRPIPRYAMSPESMEIEAGETMNTPAPAATGDALRLAQKIAAEHDDRMNSHWDQNASGIRLAREVLRLSVRVGQLEDSLHAVESERTRLAEEVEKLAQATPTEGER